MEENFLITLNDDEEFDAKKLQLVKTDYELGFLPYGILTDIIMYDGEVVISEGWVTQNLRCKVSGTHPINYPLPYVK